MTYYKHKKPFSLSNLIILVSLLTAQSNPANAAEKKKVRRPSGTEETNTSSSDTGAKAGTVDNTGASAGAHAGTDITNSGGVNTNSNSMVTSTPNDSKVKTPLEPDMEQVNVQGIKERYWARGNETELGVVQNRTYSKTHKIEIGLLGGIAFSDPFLTVKYYGGDIGYHLSEYLSLHILAWQDAVAPSNALLTFQTASGATTNTNPPSLYVGAEADWSVLYGKLSVLGRSIIYYDLHLLGGIGETKTTSGTYITPSLGIGQRFYLSKVTSLRVDYRLQYYNETILEQQIVAKLGQAIGTRDNFNNTITLALSFMLFGK